MPDLKSYMPEPKIGHDAPAKENDADLEKVIQTDKISNLAEKIDLGHWSDDKRKIKDFLREALSHTEEKINEEVLSPPIVYTDERTGRKVIGITKKIIETDEDVDFSVYDAETHELLEHKNLIFMSQLPFRYWTVLERDFEKGRPGEKSH